jgi:SAM-dependent methyltransferase
MTFTVNPDYKPERYLAAYEGTSGETPLPEEYAFVYAGPQLRLETEGRAYFCPPPRLTPSERLALQWLNAHIPPGAVVVECGCGTGRFLRALKNSRIHAAGVELSAVTVQLLNRAGLQAIQGSAPDFPWESPEPFAIAFFEVLEHIPEPRSVIEPLKKRFPKSVIVASVPSPKRWPPADGGPADSPPHHYLSWTPAALERFFTGIGFTKVSVQMPEPIGYEQMPSCGAFLSRFNRFQLRRSPESAGGGPPPKSPRPLPATPSVAMTCKIWLLAGYHLAINLMGRPSARRAARQGFSASSMLVVAEP